MFITKNEYAFQLSCKKGHIEIAKWLVSLGINFHANNELAFQVCCEKGHIEIAKWLVELGIDVHTRNDQVVKEDMLK
jgi:ankyrin repeat protein